MTTATPTRSSGGKIRAILALTDPWRFDVGQQLFVRGWSQEYTVEIWQRIPAQQLGDFIELPEEMASAMTACLPLVPHYECRDHLGDIHILSQLQLSTKPILK